MSGRDLELSPNALRVLEARYLRRDASGQVIETPAALLRRVARGVAAAEAAFGPAGEAERWEGAFHDLLASLDFLPNSPALMNAGTPLGQLAACFVLPVADTMESIFDALRAMALVQRTGGGTGFAFSRLRPRGDRLESTGGEASGPVSFMRIFDTATENIKQGGRRRGANMAVLRVDHPDIVEFVEAKRDGTSFRNFNLSVAVTDRFMRAVDADEPFALIHPSTGRPTASVLARALFARLVDAAWATGDPGLVFLDEVNRHNPTPALGAFETTNPCGEVPLLPYESCVLGSINLAHVVGAAGVDWNRLRHAVHVGVRFLDDMIEVSREPLREIAEATRRTRKIGLGVMGFAEALMLLGVPYDSEEAVAWAERLMAFVAEEARRASGALAAARGVFPAWDRSVHAAVGRRLRNATLLSIAPTGTLSLIAGTTGGIEPLFALAYRREHSLGGAPLAEINPVFLRHARRLWPRRDGLLEEILARGRLRDLPGVPEETARRFVTATEVAVGHHLRIQQAFQRHVDNAVSKTVNLPDEATPADVAEAYREAWRLGLKGVTIYRSGSKASQVLTLGLGEDLAARELFAKCDPGACRL
ncbi:MAG TPA: adenosylcobalamin-dependent ribonucleoside-diphosphate reductase [Candidatus Binatia bacterium]|nr:adenosylcobalamin-dependent ribonucleoside-diphosphate reductase [Candidatus Binatia bacterium]